MENWYLGTRFLWQRAFRAVIDTGGAVMDLFLVVTGWRVGRYMLWVVWDFGKCFFCAGTKDVAWNNAPKSGQSLSELWSELIWMKTMISLATCSARTEESPAEKAGRLFGDTKGGRWCCVAYLFASQETGYQQGRRSEPTPNYLFFERLRVTWGLVLSTTIS